MIKPREQIDDENNTIEQLQAENARLKDQLASVRKTYDDKTIQQAEEIERLKEISSELESLIEDYQKGRTNRKW